jgi:hypothetical protein
MRSRASFAALAIHDSPPPKDDASGTKPLVDGSIYYRKGAFPFVLGRFGKTPGSQKMPCFLGFSRVLRVARKSA